MRIIKEVGTTYPVAFSVLVRTVLNEQERGKFSKILDEHNLHELAELVSKTKNAA
jgi:hypothetical protein